MVDNNNHYSPFATSCCYSITLYCLVLPSVIYFSSHVGVVNAVVTVGCDPIDLLRSKCPPYSSCQPACHTSTLDYICRCDERNLFFKDTAAAAFQCYTVVRIGDRCNATTHRCPGIEAECANGICVCRPAYAPTDNLMRCKPQPFFKPQPVEFAVLNEYCNEGGDIGGSDNQNNQVLPHDQVEGGGGQLQSPSSSSPSVANRIFCVNQEEMACVGNVCRCRRGLRPATLTEMIRNPNSAFYCRPESLQLLRQDYYPTSTF